jgi:TPR repeat protein
MDLDKSGYVTDDELKDALLKLGFNLKDELIQCMVTKMDPNGDNEIVLTEFIDFFRFVAIDVRLRAEAEVLSARTGLDAVLDLNLKLGMVVNPNGQVSKVTSNCQAEALGISPGCRIVSVGDTQVSSLPQIKAAIAKAKKNGLTSAPLYFYDPRRYARASAQLAKLRSDASANAAEAALEAEKAAEKAKLKFEEEARQLAAMNELRREEALQAARKLAVEHERERQEARDLAAALAEQNRKARERAEEEARLFEMRAEEAQERARLEAKRIFDEETERQAQEAAALAHGESLKEARAVASRAVHKVIMAEIEAGKLAQEARNKAKFKAFEWWEKSSSLGCLDASNDLAMCLAYGDGCDRDTVRARNVWENAVRRGHAASMHNFAMAFINRTGIVLRFMGGGPGNMERATELLVSAARTGYQPSMDFLYELQPLSFRSPTDFQPRPMPPMKFADTIVGRRVEVYGYQESDSRFELNGMFGTVEDLRPAAGRFIVRLEDYSLVSFNRNHLQRPFIAALSEDLIKVPPPPPKELIINIDPMLPLGIDAESDTLLVIKVIPNQQAWNNGVRPGHTLASVCGIKVHNLEKASSELAASKDRRDDTCEVIFHVFESRPKGFF